MKTTNPMLHNLAPGHWNHLANTDVACPRDGELVNVQCWYCGWKRDREERRLTILGLAEPIWHRRYVNTPETR